MHSPPGEITLTGTSNASSLSIVIESSAELKDALGNSDGYLAYSSGAYAPISVTNGRWTADAGNVSQQGTYTVEVYDYSSDTLLDTETLVVSE